MKEQLNLKSLNKKVEDYQKETNEKLNTILELLKGNNNDVNLTFNKVSANYYELNIESLESDCTSADYFLDLVKSKSNEITDEYENVFVQLPTIYVKFEEDNLLKFSFDELENYTKLEPQLISKYKNSLDNGMIKSIPNVAPNFNQLSYNKSTKFCNRVGGEQLNWRTVLYLQIIWLYAYNTKENDKYVPNENYNWNTERDCGWQDTGKGIGEFLGIEQLFTSGYNYFSFSNYDELKELWNVFKQINYKTSSLNLSEYFGYFGDYDKNEDSKSLFSCDWYSGFNRSWYVDYSCRLCKKPL